MKNAAKRLVNPLLFSAFVIFTNACGQGPSNTSDLNVTNGIKLAEQEFPEVVLLVMEGPAGQSICTATFVNDAQVVTAGHCVEGLNPEKPAMAFVKYVAGRATGVKALKFKRNPRYSMLESNGVNPHDLAVVTFPADSAPAVATIAATAPEVESPLTIVGYGNNKNFMTPDGQFQGSGAGEKRIGRNQLADNQAGFLSFVGVPEAAEGIEEGELVASGSGDSGGPMFVDDQLVGVTSGGGLAKLPDGQFVVVSRYVDLNSDESRNFLQSELR